MEEVAPLRVRRMKPEQVRIAAWIKAQLQRLGWKPEHWAREAKISPTSLTRALQHDYESVTSVPLLVALAQVAGQPTILDFLDSQTKGIARSPSPRMLRPILRAVLNETDCAALNDDMLDQVAEATAFGLALVSRNPSASEDTLALQVAADAAASHIRPSRVS